MLADILHKVAAMEEEGKGEHKYYPRPSIAGPERCERQMVYWARGETGKPMPGRALVVMSDSSWHEELTADLIRKSAFQLHSEQIPITIAGAFPWLNNQGQYACHVCGEIVFRSSCHGHADFIVTDLMGQDWLIEHKGISQFSFDALLKAQAPKPNENLREYVKDVRKLWELLPLDYLAQTAIYMNGLRKLNPDLSLALLLMKNKNQSGYLEFTLQYDDPGDTLTVIDRVHHTGEKVPINIMIENITRDAFAKFADVEKHLQAQTLPDRAYEIDHWRCTYCQFYETCWRDWPAEHAQLGTDADVAEIADAARLHKELGAQIKDMTDQRSEVGQTIKDTLTKLGVRQGRAGEYTVDWTVSMMKRIDNDLLSAEAKAAATVEKPTERLNIRRITKNV